MRRLSKEMIEQLNKNTIYLMKGKISINNNYALEIVKKEIEIHGRDNVYNLVKLYHTENALISWILEMKDKKDLLNMIDDDCGRSEKDAMPQIIKLGKKIDELKKLIK